MNKNRWSFFHGMMFLFHTYWDFLSLIDTFQGLEANDCENTSFVQSETRKIVLHGVNLSMYEIKHFVVQISMNVILFFSIFYGTDVSWIFLLLSGKLARNRPKLASVCACATFDPFSPLRIVRRFSPVLSWSILIVQRNRDETDDCEET